jgi:uncharacterized small protein (DUF1192 family)
MSVTNFKNSEQAAGDTKTKKGEMMSAFDEEKIIRPTIHAIGSDLSLLSVDELDQRIALLHDEIRRLETERNSKQSSKSAAESLFRT